MPKTRLKLAAVAANRQRSEAAAREQAEQARRALKKLQAASVPVNQRWIDVLQQRIDHPSDSLRACGEAMRPPMSKHQFSAVLRRALQATEGLEL
ncbi:hypothetical protein A5742_17500 [Mycolicibacterium fortuitum]|uniref:Sporulation regulator WhiA C-terminal domain-containing protein n=2 Tax=Mycolicibacterium fortuitum TaxID=1766 RepID=A0ABD6QTQ9_MYCFO|nr:hypothetical protein A5742_17500 [Mycolicibacterium fortuitum]